MSDPPGARAVPRVLLGALLNRALVPAGQLHTAAQVGLQLASLAFWRAPVPPPALAGVYPPPPPAPPYGNALGGDATPRVGGPGGAGGPPRLIEYVPPMLPPGRAG